MTAKYDSSLPKVTIESLKRGDRFRFPGRRRTFVKHHEYGIPLPVKRDDGGYDYLSTTGARTLSGRTFDIVRTRQVIPVS